MSHPSIQEFLQKPFGLPSFRMGQKEIIGDVLQGFDCLAVMPTGGGKSLCYQLPSLVLKGITLVISPLISLMRDQVGALKEKAIAAGCIYSGQSIEEKRNVFRSMKESQSFLLYISPERVQKSGFSTWVQKAPIQLMAVDEAHCVSQWGPDFRQDYYRLDILRKLRPDVPILALTATATPQVLYDIRQQLQLNNPKRHVYGFYRPNLFYQVELCDDQEEKIQYLHAALEQTPKGRIIVYAGTRKNSEELCEILSQKFSGVGFYHAGLSSENRSEIQDEFEQGKIRILFATNAFGMGVDYPDVRLIVHFQLPANIESYYQEMGRAGRDGEHSTCILFYSKKDKGLQSFFIRQSDASKDVIHRRWRALDTMIQYAEGGECRHAGILTYFRDTQRIEACGHCDVCDFQSPRRIRLPQGFASGTSISMNHEEKEAFRKELRSRKPKKIKPKKIVAETVLSPEEKLRWQAMKKWRYQYAQEQDIPAFLVFSNKTLDDLIRKDPKNIQELANVYGVGDQKIETFGQELLKQLEFHRNEL